MYLNMRKYIMVICLTGLISLLANICVVYQEDRSGQQIWINEVCSQNKTIKRDSNRDYSDYIELYNNTDIPISLKGWFLSDDRSLPEKAELPDVDIEPGGYYVFYANGDDKDEDSLPFKIGSDGETVFLTDADGNLVDSVMIPALDADIVYARLEDGKEEWGRMAPSPEETNNGHEQFRNPVLEEPLFSVKGGFFEEPFWLEMKADFGETIYYTMDGSEPTEHSNVYTESIYIGEASGNPNVYNSIQNVVKDWENYASVSELVDKAVVVRAVSMDEQYNVSRTATETYFVGLDEYMEVDVLSVVADKDDLFGEDGIYVTGREYDEWYLNGRGGARRTNS